MEKQQQLIKEVDLALSSTIASITRAAVMQSGASKKVDQQSELHFSEYMTNLLYDYEVKTAAIFYSYQGLTGTATIAYPDIEAEEAETNTETDGVDAIFIE
jgi:hypothetical protein